MLLRQLDIHMQKGEYGPLLHIIQKLAQITDINLKLLRHDIRLQNDFLGTPSKAQ